MAVELKERKRLGNNSRILKVLKDWQSVSFNSDEVPTEEKIALFLYVKFEVNDYYLKLLAHWNKTRSTKNEYLNTEQIKDWFEFYYD